jgi:hypothetical protein
MNVITLSNRLQPNELNGTYLLQMYKYQQSATPAITNNHS